jgi:predicted O-methyltransferase YrrM
MDFFPPGISDYAERYTQVESPVLKELNRETFAHVLVPRMLSGHLQGRVLSILSKMIKPKNILEIGTYTGYSAICLSEGLQPGGMVHTLEVNEELEEMIHRYLQKAGCEDKIKTYFGNAIEIIPFLNYSFDIVFIDADKENYSDYFDLAFPKVPVGGYIFADNVLWSGNVMKPESEMDTETKAIHAFNRKVHEDKRVENVIFPIRDGIMVMRKIAE